MIHVYNLFILIYATITILCGIRIIKRDTIFGVVYILLILYSLFCMIGYVNYPERMTRTLKQYYGEDIFFPIFIYMFGFMVMTFLFWGMFIHVKINLHPRRCRFSVWGGKSLFRIICVIHLSVNLLLLMRNWKIVSYRAQNVVKGNRLWLFAFITLGVVIILLYSEIIEKWANKEKQNVIDILFLLVYGLTLGLICIRAGQRMELFMTVVGLGAVTIEKYKQINKHQEDSTIYNETSKKKRKIRRFIIFGGFLAGLGMRMIHIARGNAFSKSDMIFAIIQSILLLCNLEFWVFQDWCAPALSLVTSMHYHIVDPTSVLLSTFGNTFSFITKKSVSLAGIIKVNFDETVGVGYGFFYATEGYMLCGFMGFIVSAFILAIGYAIFRDWFVEQEETPFHNFGVGIFSYFAISVVRGTTNFFFKGFIYYFLFGSLMYMFYKGYFIWPGRGYASGCSMISSDNI